MREKWGGREIERLGERDYKELTYSIMEADK